MLSYETSFFSPHIFSVFVFFSGIFLWIIPDTSLTSRDWSTSHKPGYDWPSSRDCERPETPRPPPRQTLLGQAFLRRSSQTRTVGHPSHPTPVPQSSCAGACLRFLRATLRKMSERSPTTAETPDSGMLRAAPPFALPRQQGESRRKARPPPTITTPCCRGSATGPSGVAPQHL